MPTMRLTRDASNAIKLARFLCICFMCFVHIYGQGYITSLGLQSAATVLIEVLGRASVPLLSAISGYLAVLTIANKP